MAIPIDNNLQRILAEIERLKTQSQSTSTVDIDVMSALKVNISASSGTLLSKLETCINLLEMKKYPTPPYDCYRSKEVTYIGYTPEKDDDFGLLRRLEHTKHYAYLIRVNTLAASLLYNVESDFLYNIEPNSLALNIVEKITKRVEALVLNETGFVQANQEISFNPYDRTNDFISELAKILSEETGLPLKKQKKYIKNRERYYLSQKPQPVIVNNIYQKGMPTITQMDIPFRNPLTITQKNDYLAIHAEKEQDRPDWFNTLSWGERKWYQRFVPKSLTPESAWQQFEAMNFTSAMQQGGAGLKNARMHYFLHESPGKSPQILSKNLKIATLSPLEAPKSDRKRLAELNAEQLLDALAVEADMNFEKQWGLKPSADFKPTLYVHSLLSPLLKNIGDTNMVTTQLNAVREVMKQAKYKNYHIVAGNDSLNMFRAFVRNNDQWEHTKDLLRQAKDLLAALPQSVLGQREQEKKVKTITALCDRLNKLENTSVIKGRNRRAFKSAYEQMLVELLGGAHSENCKSGKDRTGLDELYKNAMEVYYQQYGQLPSYEDVGVKRKNFVDIFAMLYRSLKIHESAAMNTHGAFGIKDKAASKLLDPDIAEVLGHHYSESDKRANLNKTTEPNWIKKSVKFVRNIFLLLSQAGHSIALLIARVKEKIKKIFAISKREFEKETKKITSSMEGIVNKNKIINKPTPNDTRKVLDGILEKLSENGIYQDEIMRRRWIDEKFEDIGKDKTGRRLFSIVTGIEQMLEREKIPLSRRSSIEKGLVKPIYEEWCKKLGSEKLNALRTDPATQPIFKYIEEFLSEKKKYLPPLPFQTKKPEEKKEIVSAPKFKSGV